MKGSIDWNLSILGVDRDLKEFLGNWYKTVSKLYQNSYMWDLVKYSKF